MTTLVRNTDVVLLASELARIAAQNDGKLVPEAVVDEAESSDSPLHGCFEWDDTVAARAYRIDQARTLIRSVRIAYNLNTTVASCVGYIHDPESSATEGGYVAVDEIRTQPDAAHAAVNAEIQRIKSLIIRAREISSALGLAPDLEIKLREIIGTSERTSRRSGRGRRAA